MPKNVLIVLAVLWFFLPFAIFGIQPKIDTLIKEAQATKEILSDIRSLLPTAKTHVRGPLASTHARREPDPESFRFVTLYTVPPRPPTAPAPPPCAPGNAATRPAGVGLGDGEGPEGFDDVAPAVTVTVATADELLSTTLARTWYEPGVCGAV